MSGAVYEFLVLSVRPKFADAILDGRKTIEIRRQRPNVQPGTLGFVYSSSPIQAVVGLFRVDGILTATPDELWLAARCGAGISRHDFDYYLGDAEFGHAMSISCARPLPNPVKLSQLRAIWPECKPPRSFGYLVAADAQSRRLMSTFRNRFLDVGSSLEEPGKMANDMNAAKVHRGSFFLKRDEVRALAALLAPIHRKDERGGVLMG